MSDEVVQEFFSIGDVCQLTDLKPHVLRYWESQFRFLNPAKNRSGNRVYQRREVELIQLVKHLLYTEKYTIEGTRQKIDEHRKDGALRAEARGALGAEALADVEGQVVDPFGVIRAVAAAFGLAVFVGNGQQPFGEEIDVEARGVILIFFARQQIEQQRADASLLQHFGDIGVARAEAAAAAAVGEQHHSFCGRRQDQFAIEFYLSGRDMYGAHIVPP